LVGAGGFEPPTSAL